MNSFSVKNPHKSVEKSAVSNCFPSTQIALPAPINKFYSGIFPTKPGPKQAGPLLDRYQKVFFSPRNTWNYFTLLLTGWTGTSLNFQFKRFFSTQIFKQPSNSNQRRAVNFCSAGITQRCLCWPMYLFHIVVQQLGTALAKKNPVVKLGTRGSVTKNRRLDGKHHGCRFFHRIHGTKKHIYLHVVDYWW